MEPILDELCKMPILKDIELSGREDILEEVLGKLGDDDQLVNLEDAYIETSLGEYSKKGSDEYKRLLNNILYIKQSQFIKTKEREAKKLNIEAYKEIKLEELLEIDVLNESESPQIELDKQNIEDLVNKKNEDIEKWKEYNILSTMSKILDIPEDNIKYISELSEYTGFISSLDEAVNYVSRGQKDCTFELMPSLHRKYKKELEFHSNVYESEFRQKVIYYDREIKNKSDEELRAEGQHFGLPTDYLDFTEAHLISLLFAIEEYSYTKQHSIVYFMDALAYNKETIGIAEKLMDYSVPTVIESVKKYNSKSYFIRLGNSNDRIHFQKGCFLKVSNQDHEEFKEKLKKFCKVIIINKESKKDILKELFNLGITFENIYPDKDNVVKSIKFHYEEMVRGGVYE